MVVPVVVLGARETRRGGENSARRSSAAITGCQLAKKSNARFPSLCDAMLMACRCLFSTRCLHTWLDPRGISEMFLALIRNHILLLSPPPGCASFSRFLPLFLTAPSCVPAVCENDRHRRRVGDIADRISVPRTRISAREDEAAVSRVAENGGINRAPPSPRDRIAARIFMHFERGNEYARHHLPFILSSIVPGTTSLLNASSRVKSYFRRGARRFPDSKHDTPGAPVLFRPANRRKVYL